MAELEGIEMFFAGFILGIVACCLWSYYHQRKQRKLVNKVLYDYDKMSAQYFRDYQNREANGVNTSAH